MSDERTVGRATDRWAWPRWTIPTALKPDMHIWVSAKPAWLKLEDGLPQYPEWGPAW